MIQSAALKRTLGSSEDICWALFGLKKPVCISKKCYP